jgi:hypothetical protein
MSESKKQDTSEEQSSYNRNLNPLKGNGYYKAIVGI